MNRRTAIQSSLLGVAALSLGQAIGQTQSAETSASKIRHSACRWCYDDIPLEAFCERGKSVGMQSIDLLQPQEWEIAHAHGLSCTVGTAPFADIQNGFNDPGLHQSLQTNYTGLIDQAADAGVPTVIVFSGNRRNISDTAGLEHCAKGLDPLVKQAERRGITLVMELLNSKIDHADYQCDRTHWGAALVDKIGSPNFKLLYDIYHMQIMEGDVIRTIQRYHDYIAHYHTGGVPGRHEIDERQELYYPAIVRAIEETGYQDYIAQEFIPTEEDKIAALASGIRICTTA